MLYESWTHLQGLQCGWPPGSGRDRVYRADMQHNVNDNYWLW